MSQSVLEEAQPEIPSDQAVTVPLADPVFHLWLLLKTQGFKAARAYAVSLPITEEALQLLADLNASATYFEEAYQLASLTQSDMQPGARYARLALFADGLGDTAHASEYSSKAVQGQTFEEVIAWIVRLGDECEAHGAAAHLLRALEAAAPDDARRPWWLSQTLARMSPQDELIEAEHDAALVRAYALDPAVHPALPLQLALVYRRQHDWEAMAHLCRDVLSREPGNTEISWQLSYAQWQSGDAKAAEETMCDAWLLAPENGAALAAMGGYEIEQGLYKEAEVKLEMALTRRPGDTQIAVDLAELSLRRGDWPIGWMLYEERLSSKGREDTNAVMLMSSRYPRWTNEPLAGRILVVYSEQGSGDDIQMVRFVPRLADRVRAEGGRLVLACRRPLKELFQRFYADCVALEEGLPGRPDYSLPMMSLPFVLKLEPDDVQGQPYLEADAGRSIVWRNLIQAQEVDPKALRIGLVWSGNATHRRNLQRSIPLDQLEQLLQMPGVVFYALVPGQEKDVAALQQKGYPVRDLTSYYRNGFDDVAAHLNALDLLVTIDSAPLHLGGALGYPVFALLDYVSHWCWEGEANWYDSVELLRQPAPGIWEPLVHDVKTQVEGIVARRYAGGVQE
ncbi:hypothetical protein [Paraburkholderia hayleyella]|uniref:hypothetical protein n=1 Tax=Paraburkholderia hayleyella TaxID=2152889 RepID=UPI00129219A7|nr:hypothetical protein [Paraburkholderia hayleyella]